MWWTWFPRFNYQMQLETIQLLNRYWNSAEDCIFYQRGNAYVTHRDEAHIICTHCATGCNDSMCVFEQNVRVEFAREHIHAWHSYLQCNRCRSLTAPTADHTKPGKIVAVNQTNLIFRLLYFTCTLACMQACSFSVSSVTVHAWHERRAGSVWVLT